MPQKQFKLLRKLKEGKNLFCVEKENLNFAISGEGVGFVAVKKKIIPYFLVQLQFQLSNLKTLPPFAEKGQLCKLPPFYAILKNYI